VSHQRGKVEIDYREAIIPAMDAMARNGVLLVSSDESGRAGGMTISWGTVGVIWGRPVFCVLARPSRHTFQLLEASGEFTINVLPSEMGGAVDYWGKHSGRDVDKWARTGLRPAPARRVRPPIVEQGVLHFECRVIHRQDVAPQALAPELGPAYYASGDYHRVYYGEILACYGL
jgi:flavin reductase (DIM6/NTAB) family NADH-FMN oxidoreductase RutF